MNPDINKLAAVPEQEFLFRRLEDGFSGWSVLGPVLFALAVVLLISLFRRDQRLRTMLWGSLAIAVFAIPYCLVFTILFRPNAIVLLVPFLAVGLVYVGMMYYRDAQSIHPVWASFLGLLRCAVYAILAFVFLLPGCQNYEKTETYSNVLVLFDVSQSMTSRDDQLRPGEDASLLPTRQDKILKLFNTAYNLDRQQRTFLEHVLQKSPVVLYRFGGVADKEPVFFSPTDKKLLDKEEFVTWLKGDFEKWLKPDVKDLPVAKDDDPAKDKKDAARREKAALFEKLLTSTDIAGPALEIVQREAGANNIQAVILFSDGQRNRGGDEAVRELLQRASNPKRPMQIITVGVGEYRQPVGIRLNPLQAPSGVRPDDGPFKVRVPVFGDGLQGQEFNVTLEVRRTKDRDGKDLKEAKKYVVDKQPGKFKGAGEHPSDEVEFTVDLAKLTGIDPKDDPKALLQGTWEFVARVPRDPREATSKAEHVSDPPTNVLVLDKKLRVLLFASGPSRDYQFARNQFYREVLAKRMELSIYLQAAGHEDVDQDVEGHRLLTRFPDKLGKVDPEDKYTNLKEYDVILAFDADWMKLDFKQLDLLKDWVGEHAGALIFVGGPIHTDRLARGGAPDIQKKLEPLFALLPVTLNDSVLQGLESKKGADHSRPWPLKFSGNARSYDFLKLDEESPEPLAGWNRFFYDTKTPEPGKLFSPRRGFFSYHPVEKVKPAAEVLATFGDPDAPKIMEGKYEMPYFVTARYNKGKTFYIGSGELWRLRPYKETYYERFLTKLVRFVSAGGQSKRIGKFYMGPEYTTGNIQIEAEVLDKDELPLRAELKPEVKILRPGNFDKSKDRVTPASVLLGAKKAEGRPLRGVFAGSFPAETEGSYTVKIEIPGAEPFEHTFKVTSPNLEMGNLRPNFEHLYQLATDAAPVLDRLDAATRDEVLRALERPAGAEIKDGNRSASARLFFKLKSAHVIPRLLAKVPPEVNSTKGKFEDLWDKGTESGWKLEFHYVMMIAVGAIGLLAAGILFFLGRWILATSILAACLLVVLGFFVTDLIFRPDWILMPLEMSTVLGLVVGLLSAEWLTRKLLKLA